MADLHYSIQIHAPRAKVWDVMLGNETYKEWTSAFMPGSYFKGDWSEGSKMLFLGPSENGEKDGGMVAVVKENRTGEFVSLNHQAEVRDGVEVAWDGAGGFENYSFSDTEGGTLVSVDMLNIPDEYAGMFEDTWPNALEKLKEVAER